LRKLEPKACFLHDETILRRSFFCADVNYTKTNFGVIAFAVAVETSNILHSHGRVCCFAAPDARPARKILSQHKSTGTVTTIQIESPLLRTPSLFMPALSVLVPARYRDPSVAAYYTVHSYSVGTFLSIVHQCMVSATGRRGGPAPFLGTVGRSRSPLSLARKEWD
jgi:hypothetical protein